MKRARRQAAPHPSAGSDAAGTSAAAAGAAAGAAAAAAAAPAGTPAGQGVLALPDELLSTIIAGAGLESA